MREKVRSSVTSLKPRENIYNLPNFLTVSRLIAAPVTAYLLVHDQFNWALALFVYAGFTDLVDGWLARRWKLQTVAGSVIDPMADKTLMIILTGALAIKGAIPRMRSLALSSMLRLALTYHSASGYFNSRQGCFSGCCGNILSLRIASCAEDLHAILGLFTAVGRGTSNYGVKVQHLPATHTDRLDTRATSRHSGWTARWSPAKYRTARRNSASNIALLPVACRGDNSMERFQLRIPKKRCDHSGL